MKKLLFLLLFIPFLGNSQATFTAPVGYNTGAPTATPSGVGTRWRFDLLTGKKYTWLPGSLSWDEDAQGIDQVAGCSAPLYTPGYNQSTFAVNSCTVPELYQWTGAAWVRLNEGEVYTAGSGISIDGSNVITNTAPNIVQTLSIAGQQIELSDGGGRIEIPVTPTIYTSDGTLSGSRIITVRENENLSFRAWNTDNGQYPTFDINQDQIQFAYEYQDGSRSDFRASQTDVQLIRRNASNQQFFFEGTDTGFRFRGASLGAQYDQDYSADIITNPTSITDVTSVNLLKQTPVSYDNASAPNNCIFYSTTLSKLCYKDPGGTVNPLY